MRRKNRACWIVACIAIPAALAPIRANAWTAPVIISNAGAGHEASVPKVSRGSGGQIYAVYQQKDWRIRFRERSSAGTWGALQQLNNAFSVRPDVAEDSLGRVHAIYPEESANGQYDIIDHVRNAGTWTPTSLNGNNATTEDYPRVARDSQGRLHLVHTRSNPGSGSGSIIYRVYSGSAWSGETVLGSTDDIYYRRPDITVDSADSVHVVWANTGGDRFVVNYRKFSGGTWSATAGAGGSVGGSFVAYPKVAAATPGNLVVAWWETTTIYAFSGDGGVSWSARQPLSDTALGNLESGLGGEALLAGTAIADPSAVILRRWNGSAWSASERVNPGQTRWKGWVDVVQDGSGVSHLVYDDVTDANNTHEISYVNSGVDVVPPGPVTGFIAVASHNVVHLSWTNPPDLDFVGTTIRYSTSGFPATPNSGTPLANRTAVPGSADNTDHTGVTNGITYYYAAFAYDGASLYSSGANASAMPFVPCDFDRDGDVDQEDFGRFQACFTGDGFPQNDPNCIGARLDGDLDVDQLDLGVFLQCFRGANVPYDSACAG